MGVPSAQVSKHNLSSTSSQLPRLSCSAYLTVFRTASPFHCLQCCHFYLAGVFKHEKVTDHFYTHRQKLSNTILFRRQCFGSCRTELMWVMEIKYFEFYCKFYYFYEHLELKMIMSTKYFDNLRPFTKQVKNDKENQ